MKNIIVGALVFFCSQSLLSQEQGREGCAMTPGFKYSWNDVENQRWIGSQFWANSLQDWEVRNGKLYCSRPQKMSTVQIISRYQESNLDFDAEFLVGRNQMAAADTNAKVGVIFGLGDSIENNKARALIQSYSVGEGGEWFGVKGNKLFIEDLNTSKIYYSSPLDAEALTNLTTEGIKLSLKVRYRYHGIIWKPTVTLSYNNTKIEVDLEMECFKGNMALAASSLKSGVEFFFNSFSTNLDCEVPIHTMFFGPISTCLYSFNNNLLNFSSQLMPLKVHSTDSVLIEILLGKKWKKLACLPVDSTTNQSRLRNYNWPHKTNISYRANLKRGNVLTGNYYEGTITSPVSKSNELRIAAMSCNGMPFIATRNFTYKTIWSPYEILQKKLAELKPDLLVFLGDQMYESRPIPMETDSALFYADYQYRWLLWCWEMNDITRHLPTIIMMDDHDYRQGNLWGDGSRLADATVPIELPKQYVGHEDDWQTDNGGFVMNIEFLKKAQLLQTGHLPDAYQPQTNGIDNYYTTLSYRGVGMAVLEDRKFKSSPLKALPNVPTLIGITMSDSVSSSLLDNPNATLLGNDQLQMLNNWSKSEDEMKIAFTQSVYSCLSSVRKGYVPYITQNISLDKNSKQDTRLAKDMDANGWPKHGRDTALAVLRKSQALLVGGDQHFPSITQQGINNWGDAAYSITIPALNNTYPRFFMPATSDSYGDSNYIDGFGNKITMLEYHNPQRVDSLPSWLDGAPGFGFIVCDKAAKTYSMKYMNFADTSTYSREIKIAAKDNAYSSSQYETELIKVKGFGKTPLLTLKDESGNELYSLRGNNIKLNVPKEGKYIVEVSVMKGTQLKKKTFEVKSCRK